MKVKVIAREVHYDHKGRVRGEVFDADDRWAKGKILTRQVEEVKAQPVRKVATVKPPARSYSHRAVEAEAAPAPVPAEPSLPASQSYRTRRLKAED